MAHPPFLLFSVQQAEILYLTDSNIKEHFPLSLGFRINNVHGTIIILTWNGNVKFILLLIRIASLTILILKISLLYGSRFSLVLINNQVYFKVKKITKACIHLLCRSTTLLPLAPKKNSLKSHLIDVKNTQTVIPKNRMWKVLFSVCLCFVYQSAPTQTGCSACMMKQRPWGRISCQ